MKSWVLDWVLAVVGYTWILMKDMTQEQLCVGPIKRSLSRRRSLKSGKDTDDRGWTSLHVYARKGDLKYVCLILDLCILYLSLLFIYSVCVYLIYCSFGYCLIL